MSQSTGTAWKDRLYMQSSSDIPEVRENAKAILAELGRLEGLARPSGATSEQYGKNASLEAELASAKELNAAKLAAISHGLNKDEAVGFVGPDGRGSATGANATVPSSIAPTTRPYIHKRGTDPVAEFRTHERSTLASSATASRDAKLLALAWREYVREERSIDALLSAVKEFSDHIDATDESQ